MSDGTDQADAIELINYQSDPATTTGAILTMPSANPVNALGQWKTDSAVFTVDVAGRLYIATVNGVQVFDGKGEYLGTIKVPRQPSNVAFAGRKKAMLYITAREGLYRIATLTKGPTRLGK